MPFDRDKNNFLMYFENWCLGKRWDSRKGVPKGPQRIENPEWAAMMKQECQDSDTTWEEYCEWVRQGGGDEYFQEDWEAAIFQPNA